ncbi:hypothetical protein EDB92DRAFT_1818960 [Lactarius akahatsu]|uniref:Uncharacterized protein n=1 Tax=Lactarius akahatsu TaxID=416441 RepID=A0AAD4QA64_9AGAM|nr:hypothetical protein EDB92DRAFT_1818960 [Lactarius akahatsu]
MRRASVSPRHTLEAGPSGRPVNELLGSATFQTPEGDGCYLDVISILWRDSVSSSNVLSEESTQPLLTAFLQRLTRVQNRFFIILLQQMVRADPMTVLLSPAVWVSMQSQMEAKLTTMNLKSPGLQVIHARATNRQSLAFDTSSSFLSPDTANTVGNPSDAAATLAQQRAKLKAAGNAAHHSAPVLALAESVIPSAVYRLFWSLRWLCLPLPDGGGLDRLSPVVGDSWASMKMSSSSSNNNNGQTVDFTAAKLNDFYGSSNVPRLDGPDKFRRPSKGHHVGDSSNGSNNGVTNSSVYGDGNDCDFIRGHHAPGVGRVQSGSSRGLRNGGGGTLSGAQSPALSNTLGRFGGSDDRSNAMAAAHQQAVLALRAGGDRNGLNLAQLVQQNPFNMNMNMLNLAAMGVTPEAGLLAAQIAAAGRGQHNGLPGGSGRSGGRSPGLGGGRDRRSEGLQTIAEQRGWLHKYTPNFEGTTWKETVVMDEQALEAQGVAALGGAQDDGHRRLNCTSSPAAAVVWWTGTGSTGPDLGGSAGTGSRLSA